ncbi:hypothetical protein [Actinomadura welshii]|uniref:hypothetical protein n=1 Tax=Actinomadura welshii TaxID=3103817 RepID=UPI000407FDB0|nr:hypothetical protein [Actinomadura madurae]
MERDEFVIKLSADEALVLSDWLERVQMTDLGRIVDDPAVSSPLHKIAGTLDKTLPWIFATGYTERLAAAGARLTPENHEESAEGQ